MGNFERRLAVGQVGESIISRWLQSRGHSVFPAYQVEQSSGKGPQLFAASGDLVLPDLLTFNKGKVQWFEAKHKTCFTWHRISGKWTTGIDLRHYAEYQEVGHRTGLPVWLLFWHPMSEPSPADRAHGCPPVCPTGLFGNDLDVLVLNESHRSDKHGKSGMVYWAEGSLRLLAHAEDMAVAAWSDPLAKIEGISSLEELAAYKAAVSGVREYLPGELVALTRRELQLKKLKR